MSDTTDILAELIAFCAERGWTWRLLDARKFAALAPVYFCGVGVPDPWGDPDYPYHAYGSTPAEAIAGAMAVARKGTEAK